MDKKPYKPALRRFSAGLYWVILIALAFLFFTNDFGIVDLHKSAIITAVALDTTEEEVQVTAQLAVPSPSQSGDSIEYTEVQGSGETIADALNEINVKTGFYPQLHFCKLILLGESCLKKNIFRVMGCFYRKNYSELTALVAVCKGSAADTLALPTATSDMTASVILRAVSDELKKTANVAGVNLKDIAVDNFSKSGAAYLPYVEPLLSGTSEEGGNGDNVGGESVGGSGGESKGGSSQGGSGEEGGEGGQGGAGGQGGQKSGQGGEAEFTARRTAIFKGGEFAGILDERQSFALDLIKNDIRFAELPCDYNGTHYSLGLKQAKGGVDIKIKDGKPKIVFSFKATAQIAGVKKPVEPTETASDDNLPKGLLNAAAKEVEKRFSSLMDVLRQTGCDIIGAKSYLYKRYKRYFDDLNGDILNARTEYKINIRSVN